MNGSSAGVSLTDQGTLSALDVVQVVAVLAGVVRIVEGQAVSAGLQGGDAVLTEPVLVAALVVGEEAQVLVRACESLLAQS